MFILWVLLQNKTLNKCEVSIGWNYREVPFLLMAVLTAFCYGRITLGTQGSFAR